jgi:multidrug efflux pump subunit AcrB
MQAQFLIPMALSVAAGVAFSTMVTLLLIPSLLAILNDMRRAGYALFNGRWPTPEEVEPASRRHAHLEEESPVREPAVQSP